VVSHLLTVAGLDAPAAGNIGLPLSEVALRTQRPDWVVVEASSFQLADIDTFAPRVGVVTNLAPDHLDRYPTVEAYYGDKARLFRNAGPDSSWVLNAEDEAVCALPGEAAGARLFFRVSTLPSPQEQGGHVSADQWLTVRLSGRELRLLPASELSLPGRHNQANALAAAIAALVAGADPHAVTDVCARSPGSSTGWSGWARWRMCFGSTTRRRPTWSPR
jgi:UDP-N-acetylmuramoylalanine--D-glutamate ligase